MKEISKADDDAAYQQAKQAEVTYLKDTICVINDELSKTRTQIASKKKELIEARKEMYDNTSHSSTDFNKMIEMVQYAGPLQLQLKSYEETSAKIVQYEKMLQSPYFARFDFYFDEEDLEVIYIGMGNVYKEGSYQCMVYDWRTPIASVYYRYELGAASYQAPGGEIFGEVKLKRQYEIANGELQYYFDSSVRVMDSMLKKVLSGNASQKMKTIVETIQREQDVIIRDVDHDLLMVQGVAGSGKTAIALHRVAYLLYQSAGLVNKGALTSKHVLLISPNHLFGEYIANVLPELGEAAIDSKTFEDIFMDIFEKPKPQSRNETLEVLMNVRKESHRARVKNSMQFKTSADFFTLLCRYAQYIESHLVDFADLYIGNHLFADKHLLKARLLEKGRKNIPLESRLLLMENTLIEQWTEGRSKRTEELISFVEDKTDHPFDAQEFANILWHRETTILLRHIRKFTRLDYRFLYKTLFQRPALFYKLAKGLSLPKEIEAIVRGTKNMLEAGQLPYEDAMAMLALKMICARVKEYANIRQVMIDEVQDYSAVHFEICKRLFPNAKYTVLGDVNQTVEKGETLSFYDTIAAILNKKSAVRVLLNKSYRCSYEINTFSAQLTDYVADYHSVDRHEAVPTILGLADEKSLQETLVAKLKDLSLEKYHTRVILTKSMAEARRLYDIIGSQVKIRIPSSKISTLPSATLLMPIYMAKGLEFDAVFLYAVDSENYYTNDDKKLLYIGCTRALHHLTLLYKGKCSKFLEQGL